ncbi:MAG: hypothetical protein FWF69_01240 [Firmicutes bacterium]|nr:hypothetical protein [Bacillota bacterium]
MNKTEVVAQIARKTGFSADVCEKVIKAFEEQTGDALLGKLKGIQNNRTGMLASICEKTGLALADGEKAVAALEEVLGTGLSDKLRFFR